MFSIFCSPREDPKEEGDGKFPYLNQENPTFDTVETEGTDDDSSSASAIDKNLEQAHHQITSTESLLDKGTCLLMERHNSLELEHSNEMSDEVLDEREDVPLISKETSSPGLDSELAVSATMEGRDIPAHNEDKRKSQDGNEVMNIVCDTTAENVSVDVDSNAIVLYHPNKIVLAPFGDENKHSGAGSPAKDAYVVESVGERMSSIEEVRNVHLVDGSVSSSPNLSEIPCPATTMVKDSERRISSSEEQITDRAFDDGISDVVECSQGKSIPPSEQESAASAFTTPNECVDGVANDMTMVDSVKYSSPSKTSSQLLLSTDPLATQPVVLDSISYDEPEKLSSPNLLLPIHSLNDTESPPPLPRDDSNMPLLSNTDCSGDVTPLSSIESDANDDTDGDHTIESEKSVRFAEPLVTSSWDVPRVHADDLEALFYTAMDISKFRQQQKGGAPARPYDKAHCEKLVEDLDRLGAESFVAGDYQKALGAFNHSLQVKTNIMTDCDHCSTATTIHCIADVYSKKGKWIQAMDAYSAALEVLQRADNETEEVKLSKDALNQKVHIIRQLLGLQKHKGSS